MKEIIYFTIFLGLSNSLLAQKTTQTFVSTEIDNFWNAYEKIIATKDSVRQYSLLKELYFDKRAEGLKSLIEVRNSSEKDFFIR